MKELILKADGQEITVYAEENELAKLTKPERARTGYERVDEGETYYTTTNYGEEPDVVDTRRVYDNGKHCNGDYVNDKKLFHDRQRAKRLHDRLEQWQALNDNSIVWFDDSVKYRICFDYDEGQLYVCGDSRTRSEFAVYFSTSQKAKEAIEKFCIELMWYYTEYRSRLDEPERKRNK